MAYGMHELSNELHVERQEHIETARQYTKLAEAMEYLYFILEPDENVDCSKSRAAAFDIVKKHIEL